MLRRELERTSPVKCITTFPSVKCKRAFFCESKLEVDALLWLEFDDTISHYETQPTTYEYEMYERLRRYTPDLRVHRGDISYLVEIKPERQCLKPLLVEKHAVLKHFFAARRERFELMTDKDIYVGNAIANFRLLYPYRGEPMDAELLHRFQDTFPSRTMSWEELRSLMAEQHYPPAFAFRLLAYGYIDYDFLAPISNELEVIS